MLRKKCRYFLVALLFWVVLFFTGIRESISRSAYPHSINIKSSVYKSLQELFKRAPHIEQGPPQGHIAPIFCQKTESGYLIFGNYGYMWPLLIRYNRLKNLSEFIVLDGNLNEGSDGFWGKAWQFVAVNSKSGEMIAVLDHEVEGPGWELLILRSINNGGQWELLSQLKKVTYWAQFRDLAMNEESIGFLKIVLEDDIFDAKPGDYFYKTSDGGKTWRKARLDHPKITKNVLVQVPTCLSTISRISSSEEWEGFVKSLK